MGKAHVGESLDEEDGEERKASDEEEAGLPGVNCALRAHEVALWGNRARASLPFDAVTTRTPNEVNICVTTNRLVS